MSWLTWLGGLFRLHAVNVYGYGNIGSCCDIDGVEDGVEDGPMSYVNVLARD
jgi:hypothetical protein